MNHRFANKYYQPQHKWLDLRSVKHQVPSSGFLINALNSGGDASSLFSDAAEDASSFSPLAPISMAVQLGQALSPPPQQSAPPQSPGGAIAPQVEHYGPMGLLTTHIAGLASPPPVSPLPQTLQFGAPPTAPQTSIAPLQTMGNIPGGPMTIGSTGAAMPMMPSTASPIPQGVSPAMFPGNAPAPPQTPYQPQQPQYPMMPYAPGAPQPPAAYQAPSTPSSPQSAPQPAPWQQSAMNQISGLSGQPAQALPAAINSGSGVLGNAVGPMSMLNRMANLTALSLPGGNGTPTPQQIAKMNGMVPKPPPGVPDMMQAGANMAAAVVPSSEQPVSTQAALMAQAGEKFAQDEAAIIGSETGDINNMAKYLTNAQKRADGIADLAKDYLLNRANVDFKHKVMMPDTWVNTGYDPDTKKYDAADVKPRLMSKLQAYTALSRELEGFKDMNYGTADAMAHAQPKPEDYIGDALARLSPRHQDLRGQGIMGFVSGIVNGRPNTRPTATQVNDMAEYMQEQSLAKQQSFYAGINAMRQQNLPIVQKQMEGLAKTIDDAYTQRKTDQATAYTTSAGIVKSFGDRVQPFVDLAKAHSSFLGAGLAATKEVSAGSRQAAATEANFEANMAKMGFEGQKAAAEQKTKKVIAGLENITQQLKGGVTYEEALRNTYNAERAFEEGELKPIK
jgi:hypothetical protein